MAALLRNEQGRRNGMATCWGAGLGPDSLDGGSLVDLCRGIVVAAAGPIVLEIALAASVLSDDAFWWIAPFGVIPLTGMLVGGVVRARTTRQPSSAREIAAGAAAIAVPVGLVVGWMLGLLLRDLIEADPPLGVPTMFAALPSMFFVPWWTVSTFAAMAVAWLIVRHRRESPVEVE